MYIGSTLGHYGALVRKWLWLIALVVALCTGVTYAINAATPPTYETSALIQVHDISTNNGNVFNDQALAQSDALLVNRLEVLKAVVLNLHDKSITVRQLETQVSDSPLDNTPIIQVRVKGNDAVKTAKIANAVVNTFIKLQNDQANQQLKTEAAKLAKNLKAAKQAVDADQAQLAFLQEERALPANIAHQNDVMSSDQSTYNSLQTNYTQVQQQLLQVPNSLSIPQPAMPPTLPSSPRTLFNTLVAAALSLLVASVFILLLDWMNTSIKTTDDVEQLAHLNALGSVPFIKEANKKRHEHLPLVNNDAIDQAFTTISTNLVMKSSDKYALLVTSVRSQAGTSTTAINLAIALARSGVRVMLIDGNLHRGTLHMVFKHPNTYGITTVLMEGALFQEGPTPKVAIWLNQHKTSIANLWFLPTGPHPKQKGSILRSPVLATFLKCLLQTPQQEMDGIKPSLIDVIIFDTAPLEEGSDTIALASCTDLSLLVVEAGKEQAQILRKANKMLQRLYSPLQGVVINRQKNQHRPYFYVDQPQAVEDLEEDERVSKRRFLATAPWAKVSVNSTRTRHEKNTISSRRQVFPTQTQPKPSSGSLGLGQLLHSAHNHKQSSQNKGSSK